MNNFDLGRMINKLVYKQPLINQQNMQGKATGSGFIQNQPQNIISNTTQNLSQNIQQNLLAQNTQSSANLQMNTLQSIDRANYEAAEEQAKKDQVFAKKSYEKLADVEAFKELKQNADNFSVDEIVEKAKLIYADFMEQNETPEVETQPVKVMSFNFNKKEVKKSPYGNLFNKD